MNQHYQWMTKPQLIDKLCKIEAWMIEASTTSTPYLYAPTIVKQLKEILNVPNSLDSTDKIPTSRA